VLPLSEAQWSQERNSGSVLAEYIDIDTTPPNRQ
jgi:hypothetical protein